MRPTKGAPMRNPVEIANIGGFGPTPMMSSCGWRSADFASMVPSGSRS
jgi:hypothetical protein